MRTIIVFIVSVRHLNIFNKLYITTKKCRRQKWGRYHQEPSSQLITLKRQIFPVKNSNLQSSGSVGLVAKSSVFKTRQYWNLLSSHLRFRVSCNLLSSQGLIFRLPKNPVTPQKIFGRHLFTLAYKLQSI